MGRKSLEPEERQMLLYMLELWRGGADYRKGKPISVRKLSRIAIGLESASEGVPPKYSKRDDDEAPKPKPSSIAKRLERRFLGLVRSGTALPVSVFLVWKRHLILLRGGPDHHILDAHYPAATEAAARELGLSETEIIELATTGRQTLCDWFPDDHHPDVKG